MSDAKERITRELESLIPEVKELLQNPELQEFRPVLQEMLRGCESPDYDNSQNVIELFLSNRSDFVFRKIAEATFENTAMHIQKKKWYEV